VLTRESVRVEDNLTRQSAEFARAFLRPLRPYDLLDSPRIRIGRNFDGGYVMADRFEGVQAAYSLGINDDVSWDFDIAARGIDVFQYDHTIEKLPFEHPRFHWSRKGIGHVGGGDLARLEDLIEANGHFGFDNMILKCDIEGAEWLSFVFTPNPVLRRFSQIVLEIHNLGKLSDPNFAHTARQFALNLTASHRVINVHGNNYSGFDIVGGIPLPTTLELTLVRKDMGAFVPSTRTFPSAEDMPCNPYSADLHLGTFVF
jgi:hypothetical protein